VKAADRREAVSGLALSLHLDDGGERTEELRPAAPTLDAAQLLELLRLRLGALRLPSGASDVRLALSTVPAAEEQLRLFAESPRRDLGAADRALARLRAEFGDSAVVRARSREGHLPEASFAWEPLEHATLPRPRSVSRASAPKAPLVRRVVETPVALPPRPRHEPDGWLLRGLEFGPVVKFQGPYVVAGGWWAGASGNGEVRREYHFAETAKGHLFWVYYDVRRKRWYLQGEVT
jgi:protein ImuB